MNQKQATPVVRKPAKKIADAQRVRFGSGMAPANSETGTSVTNQKSFFELTSRTLARS